MITTEAVEVAAAVEVVAAAAEVEAVTTATDPVRAHSRRGRAVVALPHTPQCDVNLIPGLAHVLTIKHNQALSINL